MSLPRIFFSRLRELFVRPRLEREFDEEVRFHLDMETERNRRQGMSTGEARRAALVAFGGVERMKEDYRDARGVRLVDELRQDLAYAGARRAARTA